MLVYIVDIIITWCTSHVVQKLVQALDARFSLKDLGRINYFLGVEVIPRPDGIILSQSNYINDLLHEIKMSECNDAITPMSVSSVLTVNMNEPPIDIIDYRRIVGKLQYLSFTRPYLAFAVNKLSQFMYCPEQSHWHAIKRLLRYIRTNNTYGLHITTSSGSRLHAYSDSDWADNIIYRRSTTGYIVYYDHTPINWSSRKQKIVARSSTEVKYRVVASALAEIN